MPRTGFSSSVPQRRAGSLGAGGRLGDNAEPIDVAGTGPAVVQRRESPANSPVAHRLLGDHSGAVNAKGRASKVRYSPENDTGDSGETVNSCPQWRAVTGSPLFTW
jgi:hypothetical protein